MTHEEKREAWEETKRTGGRYAITVTYGRYGEAKSASMRFIPFKKYHEWSIPVNVWRDEMEERWGAEE